MDEKKEPEKTPAEGTKGVPTPETAIALPDGVAKEFTLPSGKKAQILHGYGRDSQLAMEIANGETKNYQLALMHLLVRIDGEKLLPDEIGALPLKEFIALQGEFAVVNFT